MWTRKNSQLRLLICALAIFCVQPTICSGQDEKGMLRLYVDNDFLAFQNKDGAYTNGLRIDFFTEEKTESSAFRGKLYFNTGSKPIVTTGWSLMQVMITSNDITLDKPMPGDYPYSGTLYLTRSFNSMNPTKRASIQTDYIIGLMGPSALAGETQDSFHRLIRQNRPKGWGHQFPTTLFLNINVSAKRFLASLSPSSELILSGEVNMGSMNSGLSVGSIFRIGRMLPYFNGQVQQFVTSKEKGWQLYFFAKSQASIVIHNALLEGTLGKAHTTVLYENAPRPAVSIRHVVFSGDLGVLFSYRVLAFSFTYKETSALIQNQPRKALGNISLYAGL
jgi:lipid A 3-O-deacylase